MSFLTKTALKRLKFKNLDVYTGLRYPSMLGDVEPGMTTMLNFNVIESVKQSYKRDRSTSFGKNAKYIKTIQLYMPAIEDGITNNYTDDKIGVMGNIIGGESAAESAALGIVGYGEQQLRNMAGTSVAAALGRKSTSATSTIFYESTQTRQISFTYSFEPRSYQDVQNVNEIIQTFRKYALPEIKGDISYFPKFWSIEETNIDSTTKEDRTWRMFKFGPAALDSVRVNLTPDQIWRTFETGDPLQIVLTLSFREIFILSQSDIDNGF